LLQNIEELLRAQKPRVCVSLEKHESGDPHLHCIVWCEGRPKLSGKTRLNLCAGYSSEGVLYQVNVKRPATTASSHKYNMLCYVMKEKMWVANFPAEKQLSQWKVGVKKPFDEVALRLHQGDDFYALLRDKSHVPVFAKNLAQLRAYCNTMRHVRQADAVNQMWRPDMLKALYQGITDSMNAAKSKLDAETVQNIGAWSHSFSSRWREDYTRALQGRDIQHSMRNYAKDYTERRILKWVLKNVRQPRGFSQKQLVISGPTAHWKSSFIQALSRMVVVHTWTYASTAGMSNYQPGVSDLTELIVFDEFLAQNNQVPTQVVQQICDGRISLNVKYSDMVTLTENKPVIFITNLPAEDWYVGVDTVIRDSIFRRVEWVNTLFPLQELTEEINTHLDQHNPTPHLLEEEPDEEETTPIDLETACVDI